MLDQGIHCTHCMNPCSSAYAVQAHARPSLRLPPNCARPHLAQCCARAKRGGKKRGKSQRAAALHWGPTCLEETAEGAHWPIGNCKSRNEIILFGNSIFSRERQTDTVCRVMMIIVRCSWPREEREKLPKSIDTISFFSSSFRCRPSPATGDWQR